MAAIPLLPNSGTLRIAVVGAGPHEPELIALSEIGPLDIEYFGIEDVQASPMHPFDLNIENDLVVREKFDLVLCSQVLEHVFDVSQGYSNLASLTKPGGLIWIGVPMSNFVHGSPDYYSAGYAPEFMSKLADKNGHEIITTGFLGSRRAYLSRHMAGIWFTDRQIQHPILSYFGCEGNFSKKILHNIKLFPARIFLAMTSNVERGNRLHGTESWALVRTR